MNNKIGVFVCHCGINIAGVVDVKKVVDEISKYPCVVHSENYVYMCSDPGQLLIKNTIKEKNLTGVVVASCSPALHEITFRRTVKEAGLNPYLLEMANIREQCSWIHQDDKEMATIKAIKIIQSMVEKLLLNDELTPVSVPITRRALVIGGGIAGIQAALDIANSGYEVVLVERNPSIGGHMAQLSETFPTLDCSQCILTPKMVDVGHHEKIKLYTYSEIEEVAGYVGNFKVKIRKKARSIDEDKCTGCGDCWTNCLVRNKPEIRVLPSVKERIESTMVKKLDEIIEKYETKREFVIAILQEITQEYNWLPKESLQYVAERLNIPFSYVYRIASFFTQFSLKPRGKHLIRICLGTACFVRGAPRLVSQIESDLSIRPGETTKDGLFTLETVNCLGACALGPLMVVDADYHGRMRPTKVVSVLKKYS